MIRHLHALGAMALMGSIAMREVDVELQYAQTNAKEPERDPTEPRLSRKARKRMERAISDPRPERKDKSPSLQRMLKSKGRR